MSDTSDEPTGRIVFVAPPVEGTGSGTVEQTTDDSAVTGRTIFVDPDSAAGGNSGNGGSSGTASDGGGKRKRGRPKGSGNARKTAQASNTINGLENILFNMHFMLAGITRVSELAIDNSEATMLAGAINNVARHYDMGATQKQLDWTNLFMAVGMIYGTRFVAIRAKRKEEPIQPSPMPQTPPRNANGDASYMQQPKSRKINIPGLPGVEVDVQ